MNIHPLHSVILIVYVFAQLCILLPTANSSTNSTSNSSSKLQRICNVPVNSFALLSLYQVISPILFAFTQPTSPPTVQPCEKRQWYQNGSGTCKNNVPPTGASITTYYASSAACCNAGAQNYMNSCIVGGAAVSCPTSVPVTPQPTEMVSIFVHLSVVLTSSQA